MLYGLRRRPERLDRHPEVRAELTALGFSWEVPRKGSRGPHKRKALASSTTPAVAPSVAQGIGAAAALGIEDGAVAPSDLVLNALQDSTQQANSLRRPPPAPRNGISCPGPPDSESGPPLAGRSVREDTKHPPGLAAKGPRAMATTSSPPPPAAEVATAPNRAGCVGDGGVVQRKRGGRSAGGAGAGNGGTPRPQRRKRADRGLAPAAQWLLEGGGVMVRGGRRRGAGGSTGASAAPGAHR